MAPAQSCPSREKVKLVHKQHSAAPLFTPLLLLDPQLPLKFRIVARSIALQQLAAVVIRGNEFSVLAWSRELSNTPGIHRRRGVSRLTLFKPRLIWL
ncbi:hypothetical protein Aduo_017151 [Ancylostoma duodenale]